MLWSTSLFSMDLTFTSIVRSLLFLHITWKAPNRKAVTEHLKFYALKIFQLLQLPVSEEILHYQVETHRWAEKSSWKQ